MDDDAIVSKVNDAIESALTEYGSEAFGEAMVPTGYVMVTEWYRADGSRVLSVIRSVNVTPWQAAGMISYAQSVEDMDYLVAGYGAATEEE